MLEDPRIGKILFARLAPEMQAKTSCRTSAAYPSLPVCDFDPPQGTALNVPLGFSDPIYAEAYVKVHGFDILLGRFF